jgi:hypothetical protein
MPIAQLTRDPQCDLFGAHVIAISQGEIRIDEV